MAMDSLFGQQDDHEGRHRKAASQAPSDAPSESHQASRCRANDAASAAVSAELVEVEQKFVEEALRASLESSNHVGVSEAIDDPAPPLEPIHVEAVAMSVVHPDPFEASAACNQYSSRFLTRPFKTRVAPGAEWSQTLLISNSGTLPWPAATNLRVVFSSLPIILSLPATQSPIPPEGIFKMDAHITLPADISNGTLVSFVLATAEGASFGDVLTVELVVDGSDGESADWQIVSDGAVPPASLASSVASNGFDDLASINAVPSARDVAMAAWIRIWKAELEVLAEMGFTDTEAIVPLLQRYIDAPVSVKHDGNQPAVPSPEGIQDVVMHLLGSSRANAF